MEWFHQPDPDSREMLDQEELDDIRNNFRKLVVNHLLCSVKQELNGAMRPQRSRKI